MLEEVRGGRVPGDDRVLEPSKVGIERHCKQEAARRTALPHTPGQEELSSSPSFKFYVCSTIAVNHSQKNTNELWQLCLLKHMENPEMTDAGICGGKIRQWDTRFMCSTRNMRQGSRLNLEDVVRHLPGRDASLRRMYTSHGVPLKASANRSGENLAITITTDEGPPAISQHGHCCRHRRIWE